VIAYITLPIFVVLATGYLVVKKPKWIKAEDLDLHTNIPSDEEVSYTEPVPKTWFGRAVNFIFT
jgi:amino acid transporter